MPNRSKAKGKAYENEVCDLFNAVFNLPFKRTFTSGAFFGGKNKDRLAQFDNGQIVASRGDIHMPKELSHIIIECKSRKEIAFHQFMQKDGSKELDSWIEQVEIDFNVSDDATICLVIFKPNRKGHFIAYSSNMEFKQERNFVCYNCKDNKYIIHELDKEWLELNKEKMLGKKEVAAPNVELNIEPKNV